jgi:expansin (peptidoglycan-binding protein)
MADWMDYFGSAADVAATQAAAAMPAASSGWESFFQGIAGSVASGYSQQQSNAFELEKAKIQYLGNNGYYTAGQPGVAGAAGINSGTLLLLAAAVALYLVLK